MIQWIQCRCDQWVRVRRQRSTTTVRTGDDLEQVAVRIVEVDSPPIIPLVGVTRLFAIGVSPILEASFTNPFKNLVKLEFTHQESIVLWWNLALGPEIIQRDIPDLHHRKWAQ